MVDPAAIREDLERIRQRGYAVSFGEGHEADMAGITAPIFDARGTVIGGLLVSVPSNRVTDRAELDKIGISVRQAADEVSLGLGWMPRP